MIKNGERAIDLVCVQQRESDALMIMEWRNDPLTLEMSYHSTPKTWDAFYREFKEEYFSLPDLPPLFILAEGKKIGFVRFKNVAHPKGLEGRRCAEISINIAKEFRGRGFGSLSLNVLREWAANQGYDDLYAEVKEENIPSQNAFISVGFSPLSNDVKKIDTGECFLIRRFYVRLSPLAKNTNRNVFIIAEAGSNWRMGSGSRDWTMAKALIDVAADAGADAVKFQVFRPQTTYAQGAGKSDYLSEAGIQEDILDIFSDLSMPYEMIPELAGYCKKKNIEFMATPFSSTDFAVIDPYVKRHKIASYEISHLRLLESAALSQKPVYMSTGAAKEEEIGWAVDFLRANGCQDLTLLQCTAKYPADSKDLNLSVLPWLKSRYRTSIGLSDHSIVPATAPIAAVALGATVIEKHFTLHHQLPGPDHFFALLPEELHEMVNAIRQTELMLGTGVKSVLPVEEELRQFCRRGIHTLKEIQQGEVLQEGVNIEVLRAGKQPPGIHSKYLCKLEGKKASRELLSGQGIQQGDWEL